MKRLTTDHPKDNAQTLVNLYYKKDGWPWERGIGEMKGEDIPLHEIIRGLYTKNFADSGLLKEDDDAWTMIFKILFNEKTDRIMIFAKMYGAAFAACELRERLKAIEDILGEDYDLEKLKELVQAGKHDAARLGKWISVNERLPEESDNMVLAIVNGKPHENCTLVGAYQLASYAPDEGWIVEEYPEWQDAVVSYWMPLPEPPENCDNLHAETASHSEAAILRGCIALMQDLMGRFEEYLDFIDFHPDNEEERFCTEFYMTKIVKRLFLWETHHSGGTSQRLKLQELGVDKETVAFEDTREMEEQSEADSI